ncbi:hypothetical protein D3C84_960280 [compost metagenome]
MLLGGPGESAFDVTKEFALHELRRDRAAIERYERLLCPVAELVQGACHQLLTRAGFAVNEDGAGQGGESFDQGI